MNRQIEFRYRDNYDDSLSDYTWSVSDIVGQIKWDDRDVKYALAALMELMMNQGIADPMDILGILGRSAEYIPVDLKRAERAASPTEGPES
jgi:hypothetical protein